MSLPVLPTVRSFLVLQDYSHGQDEPEEEEDHSYAAPAATAAAVGAAAGLGAAAASHTASEIKTWSVTVRRLDQAHSKREADPACSADARREEEEKEGHARHRKRRSLLRERE